MADPEALSRWAAAEMALPPSALPSEAALRRLHLGPCAPIWDFITRHIRHPRNAQKIRGNLAWYRHLEEMEGSGSLPLRAELQGKLEQLQRELGALGEQLAGAQEAAMELEEALGSRLSQREWRLRRALELRLLGGAVAREGRSLHEGRGLLHPPQRPAQALQELGTMVAVGLEPPVLASVRAACWIRAEALEELLEPRPPEQTEKLMAAANERWVQAAQEVLSTYPPSAVLWALEHLATESTQLPPRSQPEPDLDPEAVPSVRSQIQKSWVEVGGLWGRLPPLLAHLRPLRSRLLRLRQLLAQRLGEDPETLQVARLRVELAALRGARAALAGGLPPDPKLRGFTPEPGGTPKAKRFALNLKQRERLWRAKTRVRRRQRRLQALGEAMRRLKAKLQPLAAQARSLGLAGVGGAAAALAREGQRLLGELEELGELGALRALGTAPEGPGPSPLLPALRNLGLQPCQDPQGALWRAAALRREVRRGAEPREGAELPPTAEPVGVAADHVTLHRVSLVAAQCRKGLQEWPRLQGLVSQWWEQPAQWALPPPPGRPSLSHWLQRWSRAARVLAPPPRQEGPQEEQQQEGVASANHAP